MAHLKFLCHQFILPYLLFSLHSTTSPTYQLLTPLSITYSTFLSFHQFNLFSLSYVVFYFLHNLTPVSLVIRTPPPQSIYFFSTSHFLYAYVTQMQDLLFFTSLFSHLCLPIHGFAFQSGNLPDFLFFLDSNPSVLPSIFFLFPFSLLILFSHIIHIYSFIEATHPLRYFV